MQVENGTHLTGEETRLKLQVTQVVLFMHRAARVGLGCGPVSFSDKAAAQAAIDALNEKTAMTV